MKMRGFKVLGFGAVAALSATGALVLTAVGTGSDDTDQSLAPTSVSVVAPTTAASAAAPATSSTTSTTTSTTPPLHLVDVVASEGPSRSPEGVLEAPTIAIPDDPDRQLFPWLLPPIAERRETEEAQRVEAEMLAEAAAAAAPPAATTPPASTTAPPSGQPQAAVPVNNTATYAGRGGVGYLGVFESLTVIESAATAPVGTTWDDARKVLNVNSPDLTLDHVFVKGGVDVNGGGTTTITNSIIEFGYAEEMGVLMRASSGGLVMTDSTIRRLAGTTPSVGNGRGGIQISGGHPMTLRRNDISGLPDGMQLSGNNITVEWNWIHDLAMVGSYPNNTHNDGVQLYGGTNIRFAHNRIEIGAREPYSNGALFFQGSGIGSVTIESNYLDGGGYSIRLETGQVSVVNNVVGGNYLWGNRFIGAGATIVEWRDNIDLNAERMAAEGAEITPP